MLTKKSRIPQGVADVFDSIELRNSGGSRVAYSLAKEGEIPFSRVFSKLNKAQVPSNSIYLVGGIGALYAVSGQFNLLTDVAVFASWTFYTLTFLGVMKLRKDQPEAVRTYRVPLYPVVPIVAVISGIYVIISRVFLSGLQATLLSIASMTVTLIGVPVYYATRNGKKGKTLKSKKSIDVA